MNTEHHQADVAAKHCPRPRAQDVDRHIGARLREQRVLHGLSQYQLAELIGVTYQQAHKYETGVNRISASRLWTIAHVLGVEITAFFAGLERPKVRADVAGQRGFIDLRRSFDRIKRPSHKRLLCQIAAIVAGEPDAERAADGV